MVVVVGISVLLLSTAFPHGGRGVVVVLVLVDVVVVVVGTVVGVISSALVSVTV